MSIDFANIAALKTFITAELGGLGGINIELLDIHLVRAITDACDVLTRFKPGTNAIYQPYSAGTYRYVFNLTNMPGFMDISHVDFVKPELTGAGFLLENPFRLDTVIGMGMGTCTLAYGDFALSLSRLKEAKRVFSIEPQWAGQWEVIVPDPIGAPTVKQRVYALYLRMPDPAIALAYDVTVFYNFGYTSTDDLAVGIPAIPMQHQTWFKNYALAKAKIMLGRIRNKFKGIPGADEGSSYDIDGADLIAEGREEVSEIETMLAETRAQIAPILG
jgi:hypothetical protein